MHVKLFVGFDSDEPFWAGWNALLWRPEALDCRALILPETWKDNLGFEPQTPCI